MLGLAIAKSDTIHDLGVLPNSCLSLTEYITKVINYTFQVQGVIYRMTRIFRTQAGMINLFCELVLSKLEFFSAV